VVGEVLHAFRTAPNQPYNPATDDLGTLDVGIFDWSEAHGITDSGQVVGVSGGHAFRTGPNQPINPATDDLGPALYVYGINNSGQVVGSNFSHDQGGWGEPPDPRLFAWVYSGNGPMQYLNELIDPASGWVLHEPRDINDLGQIVGWGLHNGNERAFLLTPIPEPASLVMLGGCLVGLSLLRRRRCCAA
ncbi:MAG: PEP-CTERM sorting domain-containing protein, partial [Pirellulales bacterium]